jgi:nucleotide-binding universal stress UspA family protein
MYKFERILCATDFSEASLETVRFAAYAVKEWGGSITLLYVDEFEKSPVGVFSQSETERKEFRTRVEQFAANRFQEIIRTVQLHPQKTNFLVRFGTAYHEITAEAETGNYSAVALSTQGLGASSPHLMGRTVERVVRICRAPVVTLRPKDHSPVREIKTILCPTDFSEYGNYALPYAISLARSFKAKLLLLHVTELNVSNPEKLINKFPDPALYHEHYSDVVFERLVGSDVVPENTIVRVAGDYDIDFMVMGTHGARGLRRVQIGNTTEEVIRRIEIPVLSITHPIHRMVFPRRFSEEYEK